MESSALSTMTDLDLSEERHTCVWTHKGECCLDYENPTLRWFVDLEGLELEGKGKFIFMNNVIVVFFKFRLRNDFLYI